MKKNKSHLEKSSEKLKIFKNFKFEQDNYI